jgi:hypothetical protein
MREMQLLNTAVLDLASSPGDLVDNSSPSAQSPTTSPPPTSANKTNNTASSNQNGRHMQSISHTQQNGRNYPFGQQLLLHPAFRGLTARSQLPGMTSGKLRVNLDNALTLLVSLKARVRMPGAKHHLHSFQCNDHIHGKCSVLSSQTVTAFVILP